MKTNVTLPHLGGHLNRTHVDLGALIFLLETFRPKTALDIGCGPFGMLPLFTQLGISAIGLDGDPNVGLGSNHIIRHDFTNGPLRLHTKFDLAWSVEFLEHVEAEFVPDVMSAFNLCTVACVTAAPPGHAGHHHVNCQPQSYWEEVFSGYGFEFLERETEEIRRRSTMAKGFMQRTGMIFQKMRRDRYA